MGVKTLFIEPGSFWENDFNKSFNGKLRDELLNGEIFYSLKKSQVLIERWRQEYNTIRPHSARGYRSPTPATRLPLGEPIRYLDNHLRIKSDEYKLGSKLETGDRSS